MKSTGIVRKLDELGRIVIPKELRNIKKIDSRSKIEIFVSNDGIVLKKFQTSCILCGNEYGLLTINDNKICSECIKQIKDL